MFSKIIQEGQFILGPGVRSTYTYEYGLLSDDMSRAYCMALNDKLEAWQNRHGKFHVVIGCETQGIRIGYQLSQIMGLPFHLMPKRRIDFAQLVVPKFSPDTHLLIVDDIVTTGTTFMRAVEYLDIEEGKETITFACMIRRNPRNLDYSRVHQAPDQEQFFVREERFDFIDKRLVSLYSEPE